VAVLINQIGTMVESISRAKTMRPPYVGPHPQRQADQRAGENRGRRQQAELGILSCSPVLIGMPMMENITHTAKQTVKARVFMVRTEICLRL
jgi:hypothetical protein